MTVDEPRGPRHPHRRVAVRPIPAGVSYVAASGPATCNSPERARPVRGRRLHQQRRDGNWSAEWTETDLYGTAPPGPREGSPGSRAGCSNSGTCSRPSGPLQQRGSFAGTPARTAGNLVEAGDDTVEQGGHPHRRQPDHLPRHHRRRGRRSSGRRPSPGRQRHGQLHWPTRRPGCRRGPDRRVQLNGGGGRTYRTLDGGSANPRPRRTSPRRPPPPRSSSASGPRTATTTTAGATRQRAHHLQRPRQRLAALIRRTANLHRRPTATLSFATPPPMPTSGGRHRSCVEASPRRRPLHHPGDFHRASATPDHDLQPQQPDQLRFREHDHPLPRDRRVHGGATRRSPSTMSTSASPTIRSHAPAEFVDSFGALSASGRAAHPHR